MPHATTVDVVTSATKEIKMQLFGLVGVTAETDSTTEEKCQIVKTGILNILQNCGKEEKALVHLQLLFHLPYQDLEFILEDPGDFVFIVPAFMFKTRVPVSLYCDLVVEADLLSHFMQMATLLYNKDFVQQLVAAVIHRLLKSENPQEIYPYVLSMLVKISRRQLAADGGTFFLQQFDILLQKFLGVDDMKMAKYEKLCFLFRFAGTSCMMQGDYKASGSDLVELIEEWNYDSTNRIAKETRDYLSVIFKLESSIDKSDVPVRAEPLYSIANAIATLTMSEDEQMSWGGIRKTHRITWLEFIGVHAFITISLLEKYCLGIEVDMTKLASLTSTASTFASHRPKLTREDFQGEVGDFDHYHKVLKRFGEKDRDRKNLLPKLLNFSYSEIFLQKEGIRIADKYLLPGGNYETVSNYINKALDKASMPPHIKGVVPGTVKVIIIRLISCNPEVKLRKAEMVEQIFKNGAHAELLLPDFGMYLNNLCSKVGTIEKEEKDLAQIEHNQELVFNICIQNPLAAVESLMKQTISSQHYKALHFAKPFLMISNGCPNPKNPSSVRNLCFEKIIDSTDEHDQLFTSLVNAVPILISSDLMGAVELYHILKNKITSMFQSNTMKLKKISKLFQIVDALVLFQTTSSKHLNTDLLRKIYKFALRVKIFTFYKLYRRTSKEMLLIRSICDNIEASIIQENVVPDVTLRHAENTTSERLAELTLLEIGYLYIRMPAMHLKIQEMLFEQDSLNSEPGTLLEYSNVQDALIRWVKNTDADKWQTVLDFVTDVLFIVKEGTQRFFFDIDLPKLICHSLLSVWLNSFNVKAQATLRQYLKFINKSVHHLFEKNLLPKEGQLRFIKTLVALTQSMSESMKRRKFGKDKSTIETSIQQVLLLLLEVLNLVVARNPDFKSTMQEDILDIICHIPVVKKSCESIRTCVIDRIHKHNDSKVMPLPGYTREGNPALTEERTLFIKNGILEDGDGTPVII